MNISNERFFSSWANPFSAS